MALLASLAAVKGIGEIGGLLFGGGSETTTVGDTAKKGSASSTERLKIDQRGIEALVADVLSSQQGLASIFGEEQVAGIFDSSVAARASGDLISQVAGEIAKLTAVKEKTSKEDSKTTAKQVESTDEEGLLDSIGKFIKKI